MQTNALSYQDSITQEKDTLYPHSFLNHDNISSAFIEELASLEFVALESLFVSSVILKSMLYMHEVFVFTAVFIFLDIFIKLIVVKLCMLPIRLYGCKSLKKTYLYLPKMMIFAILKVL
ncbi:MAG: hypothetical protein MR025_08745 [Helicobacter trogontum]|uniref:hypothetical protein n=1 Tax=Helicobacter trogontum TaxID=50960 RepID=UPI00242C2F4E|nr:hypothetical protein [Helicobacter trogontum]MCI5787510.1 hypothetical protein [Helicobacter trogontum]